MHDLTPPPPKKKGGYSLAFAFALIVLIFREKKNLKRRKITCLFSILQKLVVEHTYFLTHLPVPLNYKHIYIKKSLQHL